MLAIMQPADILKIEGAKRNGTQKKIKEKTLQLLDSSAAS